MPIYTEGDQLHYIKFYNNITQYDIFTGYVYYFNTLGAREPFYYLLIYSSSNLGIEKEILMTIINVLFSYLLINTLQKIKVNAFIAFTFLLNFYYLVLLFAAERLKIALLILLLSFIVVSKFWKFVLSIFSFLTHFQVVLLLVTTLYDNVSSYLKEIKSYMKRGLIALILIAFLGAIIIYFSDALFIKYRAYEDNSGLMNVLKPAVFLILTLLIGKNKRLKIFIQFLPLLIASVLVGADRIVILCYFIFLFYGLRIKHGFNVLILTTSLYFAFTGYEFIQNIIEYGTGFHD